MKQEKTPLMQRDGTVKLLASLLSIVIGLVVGGLIVLFVGLGNPSIGADGAWEGLRLIFAGILSTGRSAAGALTWGFNPTNVGNMLFRAMPVIMTGLSVAVAFKTGLFNIGAPGQYLMGTAASLFIALRIPSAQIPPLLIWILALLGGCLAGAVWGSIPGILKAYLNINEVIASIMTNWIAANLVKWFFEVQDDLKNTTQGGKVGYIYKTSENGVATPKMLLDKIFPGSQVNGGILIAILVAVIVFIIMSKTTFGYQLKACGANRFASRYAGINDKKYIILAMTIAGSLSGLGAALYYLSGNTELAWETSMTLPSEGFNGIPVALLAANHPIGVIFTGMFMSILNISGLEIKRLTTYNEFLTDIIIAVIVYLSSFSLVIKMIISGKIKLGGKKKAKKPPVQEQPITEQAPAAQADKNEEEASA